MTSPLSGTLVVRGAWSIQSDYLADAQLRQVLVEQKPAQLAGLSFLLKRTPKTSLK